MAKAKVLTKDEAKRVLRIAETLNHGQRDKVALALSIMGGMRVPPPSAGPFLNDDLRDVPSIDRRGRHSVFLDKFVQQSPQLRALLGR